MDLVARLSNKTLLKKGDEKLWPPLQWKEEKLQVMGRARTTGVRIGKMKEGIQDTSIPTQKRQNASLHAKNNRHGGGTKWCATVKSWSKRGKRRAVH